MELFSDCKTRTRIPCSVEHSCRMGGHVGCALCMNLVWQDSRDTLGVMFLEHDLETIHRSRLEPRGRKEFAQAKASRRPRSRPSPRTGNGRLVAEVVQANTQGLWHQCPFHDRHCVEAEQRLRDVWALSVAIALCANPRGVHRKHFSWVLSSESHLQLQLHSCPQGVEAQVGVV